MSDDYPAPTLTSNFPDVRAAEGRPLARSWASAIRSPKTRPSGSPSPGGSQWSQHRH
jgi:hypothetical protein